jgi:hypothetical protein
MSYPMAESPGWTERLLGSSGDLGAFSPTAALFPDR